MQVSTRMFYPDPGPSRQRARGWQRVMPVGADDRGSGYKGNLARSSHQAVNERAPGGSADKEVFVARSLSSTLAMLQMHVAADAACAAPAESSGEAIPSSRESSFVQDLFAGVLSAYGTQ